jgi:hypothetical protein
VHAPRVMPGLSVNSVKPRWPDDAVEVAPFLRVQLQSFRQGVKDLRGWSEFSTLLEPRVVVDADASGGSNFFAA